MVNFYSHGEAPQHNDFHCAGATLWLKLHEDKNIAKDNLVLLLQ